MFLRQNLRTMPLTLTPVRSPKISETVLLVGYVPTGDGKKMAALHAVVTNFDGWVAALDVWCEDCLGGGVMRLGYALALPAGQEWKFGFLTLFRLGLK